MSKPRVNVLYAPGTNCHKETLNVFERVGARAELLMLKEVLAGQRQLDDADVLCLPGGFSYGDHAGAGTIVAQFLRTRLAEQLQRARQKPMIAICNGYQTALRAGIFGDGVALVQNVQGTFNHVMYQQHHIDENTNNVWLSSLRGQHLRFPCAHGEGRFMFESRDGWNTAIRYPDGTNPDGSTDDIGGITTPDGLVLGLMNHPERRADLPGNLDIFANGVKATT